MTMTKREKVLVSVVLVMAVFCLYFLFYFKPNMDQLSILKDDISNKESLAATVSQQRQIIAAMDKAIEDNEARIKELSGGISIGFDQPAVLVYLEKTVNEHATKYTFTFNDITQVGQLYVVPVNITMACSFDGLKALMSAFNDSPYFIKVVAIKVTTIPETTPVTQEGETTQTAVPSTPAVKNDEMAITLDIEFYGQPGELEAGRTYDFAEGYQYGGDIFN